MAYEILMHTTAKKKTQTQRAVHIVSFHLYAVQEQAQLIYNDKSESGCLNDGRGY